MTKTRPLKDEKNLKMYALREKKSNQSTSHVVKKENFQCCFTLQVVYTDQAPVVGSFHVPVCLSYEDFPSKTIQYNHPCAIFNVLFTFCLHLTQKEKWVQSLFIAFMQCHTYRHLHSLNEQIYANTNERAQYET